mgnify:CR=1 FL=1
MYFKKMRIDLMSINLQKLLLCMRQKIASYDTDLNIITVSELRIEILLHVKGYEIIKCVFIILQKKVIKHLRKYGQRHDIIDQLLVKKQSFGVEMIEQRIGIKMLRIFTKLFK